MNVLHPHLAKINEQVIPTLPQHLSLDPNDAHEKTTTDPPIACVSSQGYNAVMHRTRYRVKDHKVQRGLITGALAGTHATDIKAKTRCKNLHRALDTNGLPHEDFEEKSAAPDIARDLRLENVFTIDLTKVRVQCRNGWYVFDYTRLYSGPF
jgi:hypothetical protein